MPYLYELLVGYRHALPVRVPSKAWNYTRFGRYARYLPYLWHAWDESFGLSITGV